MDRQEIEEKSIEKLNLNRLLIFNILEKATGYKVFSIGQNENAREYEEPYLVVRFDSDVVNSTNSCTSTTTYTILVYVPTDSILILDQLCDIIINSLEMKTSRAIRYVSQSTDYRDTTLNKYMRSLSFDIGRGK